MSTVPPSTSGAEPVLVEDLSLTLRGASAASLVGVIGPLGCGKTSGLRAWARDADRPVFWFSADASSGFDLLATLESLAGSGDE